MTIAERAFIANSKVLLRLGDIGRIEEFLPKLDELIKNHPEMMYPGYFYGKLLLALGSDTEEALKVVIPFARKKASEFWVWQLISDVYANDPEKQLACLLRAVHCKTKEDFLGKVRIKLAEIYIRQNKFDYAKHHIDAVTRCCMKNGRRLPYQIDFWIHQPWLTTVNSNPNNPIDFESITNDILCVGTEEAIAIVSYFDDNSHKASLVFGVKQKMSQKLRIKVKIGDCLKINYITDKEGKVKILNSIKVSVPQELEYAKFIDATIDKRDDKPFAFLKGSHDKVFIAPNIVQKFNLHNGDVVNCLAVYDYDKKKNTWNWVGVNFINKKNGKSNISRENSSSQSFN